MKILLSVLILFCWFGTNAQSLQNVDIRNTPHHEAYLMRIATGEKTDKIFWYPSLNAFRYCNDFSGVKPLPAGFTHSDENCHCGENARPNPTSAGYSNIQFDFDSSVLRQSSYPVLDAASADLRSSEAVVTLAGYASSEGSAAHNMRLAKDRANSVKTYLVNSGVDAKRLKVKSFGETHPIADNSTEDGRVQNRRVEFHK